MVRVGNKKTNWIRQLECTTPFAPLNPQLKQLLWLYNQRFSSLKEVRVNLVVLADDLKKKYHLCYLDLNDRNIGALIA